jgi:NAD(P)H dehydrogenase (quinone)
MSKLYSVFSHPHKSSTTSAISNLVREVGLDKGYTVNANDLYRNEFNPVLSAADIVGFRNGKLSQDILFEQQLLSESSVLVLGYPIWWAGMPALLKGWIDRVLSYDFAYTVENGKPKGLLQGKKAIIINTHGQSSEEYRKSGMFNAMNMVSDIGIFDFCGIEVIEHLYYEDNAMNTEARASLLSEIENDLLQAIPNLYE